MAQTAEGNALTPDERERMHGGKRRFTSESEAIQFAARNRARGKVTGAGAVYRCLVCKGYHVGRGRPPMAA